MQDEGRDGSVSYDWIFSPFRPGSAASFKKNISIRAHRLSVSSHRFAIRCAQNRFIRDAMNLGINLEVSVRSQAFNAGLARPATS